MKFIIPKAKKAYFTVTQFTQIHNKIQCKNSFKRNISSPTGIGADFHRVMAAGIITACTACTIVRAVDKPMAKSMGMGKFRPPQLRNRITIFMKFEP